MVLVFVGYWGFHALFFFFNAHVERGMKNKSRGWKKAKPMQSLLKRHLKSF